MTISIRKISATVLAVVLLSLVVDIGGAFGVKYAATGLMLLWAFAVAAYSGIRRDLAVEFGLLIFFLFGACYALFLGIGISEIYGQLSFVVYLFLLVVLLEVQRGAAEKIFRRVAMFASIVIVVTYLSILVFPATAVAWNSLGENYRLGYLGMQPLGDMTIPNVYYRWSMWLIPAFIISVGKYNATAILIGIAAALTMSTSVVFFTVLGALLVLVALRDARPLSIRGATFVALCAVAVFAVSEAYLSLSEMLYENIASKFSSSSYSTSVKLGHISGVLSAMGTSLQTTLFGMGAGSDFFSPGIRDYVVNVEVSHFNFVRQFGVAGGLLFFSYVMYVIYTAYESDALGKRWSIGLLMLFIAAGTNPLLMSPVFMVVLLMVRSHVANFAAERATEL